MVQISCQNLSLGYEKKNIVENLTFSVYKGDYLCIVGDNGSGKSTLMRTMLQLQQPTAGKVLTGEGLKRNEIGYLPQQMSVQKDFPATVREIILSGCQARCGIRPFYIREEKEYAKACMEKMGMKGMERECFRELSGGQKQRVLLARALCAAKKILFLDEPVTGLDPKAAAEMYSLIADVNKREGITVVMITHDMETAPGYASHILHMGKNWFYGPKKEYVQRRREIKAPEPSGGGKYV